PRCCPWPALRPVRLPDFRSRPASSIPFAGVSMTPKRIGILREAEETPVFFFSPLSVVPPPFLLLSGRGMKGRVKSPITACQRVLTLAARAHGPRRLSAIRRPPASIVRSLAHGPDAAATVMHALQMADRDHAQPPQPSFHHAECMLVDDADFAQAELVVRELQPACLAGVRKCAPAHAEAARPVEFAQQPQRDLVETAHAPSDTLVVVDCVGSRRARIRRQFLRHQTTRSSAMKQLAQAEIKAQSFPRSSEAGLVFIKHR